MRKPINGFNPTRIIVWVNGSEYWNHVYLKDGKFYIMWTPTFFEPLENLHVDRTDTI